VQIADFLTISAEKNPQKFPQDKAHKLWRLFCPKSDVESSSFKAAKTLLTVARASITKSEAAALEWAAACCEESIS
jgi:hypothetical protein